MFTQKCLFEQKEINSKTTFIPVVQSEILIGENNYNLLLCFKKFYGLVEIFISIDESLLGFITFKKREDFSALQKIIGEIKNSSLDSEFNMDEVLWSKKFPFTKDFKYKVVEETITFNTLLLLIELHFPTNWLLLME